jgi:transposase
MMGNSKLEERRADIDTMLGEGFTASEIARRLSVPGSTLSSYLGIKEIVNPRTGRPFCPSYRKRIKGTKRAKKATPAPVSVVAAIPPDVDLGAALLESFLKRLEKLEHDRRVLLSRLSELEKENATLQLTVSAYERETEAKRRQRIRANLALSGE